LAGGKVVVFDAEHGPIDPLSCENMTRAAQVSGAVPMVRVPANDRVAILRYLDVGPQGLHVPMIGSAADARDAVRFAKYVPEGERGLGTVRAADYGLRGGLDVYVRRANAEALIVAQIESAEAVERIDEILDVAGIDVVFIGPTDLAHSLGVIGQRDHPLLTDAFDRICDAVRSSATTLGILVSSEQDASAWAQRGARYFCVTLEALLRRASAGLLSELRQRVRSGGGT
jgi:4-hydroxy-2-oxoheptanedioate aldolase